MAVIGVRCLSLTVFLMAVILAMGNSGVRAQCEASIPSLIAECQQYVSKTGPKIRPSAGCCSVVKDLDIPCVCKMVTKEVERLVSMEKVVFVGRSCGLKIAKGTKCGTGVRCLCFAVFLMAGILVLGNSGVRAQCEASVPNFVAQCGPYIIKSGPQTKPSEGCCSVVKTLDIPCLCKLVTKEIEEIISLEKTVFVFRTCGREVAKGAKCGSYTVPNALH
ncbi:hypothetical protein FEM48_ZijujUnG0023900 [Ziziphus jujuba var. spinosa]|uniref:Bifunctional inhibitor/plant lipid transfer protein/seed storage helical domain-containing protein n=1 Tax=Ziziphus jujuba var. spinosa TaxID=714518 RepID=A0A978U9Q1_ZIZJJ|nr:hypothetical protein FEM48_ZijujUnG0023900 [Ziziphus jujuba var. spinosa]